MFSRFLAVAFLAVLFLPAGAEARSPKAAKQLFGHVNGPAKMKPRPIGFYTKGCLAGGKQLAKTGPAWQAMRLSRNRNWGHPVLIDFLEKLAVNAKEKDGWPGLLVGDLSQPRGGPMLTGHRSHQIGLDADIWLTPMPKNVQSYRQRESRSAISMLAKGGLEVHPKKWSMARAKLIKRAAESRGVARIFVHPAIKKALCEASDKIGTDRSWLRRVRPWWGHHYHFHVRLNCPSGMAGCKSQPAPPVGDGCAKQLDHWFAMMRPKKIKKPVKPVKKRKKRKKRRVLTLASLPHGCTTVISKGNKTLQKQLRAGKIVGHIPVPARNPRRVAKPQNMLEKLINGLKADGKNTVTPVVENEN
ncbi:MAG: penicillin-insensitive murein endopeptidase [bacterium]|nr:penicillin-insensitive murein endopeptidase [bacterium]